VLYNKETNELKLIDFGISKKMIQKEMSFTPCGDEFYMAPEMLEGNGYNEKVDIY
jgi:serine/threonine protein kinase